METGRRRRGRPKYTVLDISRVEDVNVVEGFSKEETAILESEEEKKEKESEIKKKLNASGLCALQSAWCPGAGANCTCVGVEWVLLACRGCVSLC